MNNLLTLQNLELQLDEPSSAEKRHLRNLRKLIPDAILGRYDRFRARDKKAVALVRNGVCGECHLQVATGIMNALIAGTEVQSCGNCGRYLFLAEENLVVPPSLSGSPGLDRLRAGESWRSSCRSPVTSDSTRSRSCAPEGILPKSVRLLLGATLCFSALFQARGDNSWTATPIGTVENFDVPECVACDAENNVAFVSNISAKEGAYWSDDGKGFISLLSPAGAMKNPSWLDSTPAAPIHAPKGMCILNGHLYFTDNHRLMRCVIAANGKAGEMEMISLPGAKKLNDLASDGKTVLVSDTEAGKVFQVEVSGKLREIPAPQSVNGVTFHERKIFAVSWDLHDVYELDAKGKNPPKPFGLAAHFTNLDGIEVLEDGSFLVSDFTGNKVSLISPDRKSVRTFVGIESPADIGFDSVRGILYVPQFLKNQVAIFRLERSALRTTLLK